jgi:hypothetical protein
MNLRGIIFASQNKCEVLSPITFDSVVPDSKIEELLREYHFNFAVLLRYEVLEMIDLSSDCIDIAPLHKVYR